MTIEEAGAHRGSVERVYAIVHRHYSDIYKLGEDVVEKQVRERLAFELVNKLVEENIIMFEEQHGIDGIDYKAVIYAVKFNNSNNKQ